MSGRHVRTFVGDGEDGTPQEAFPATGRRFATTQSHWMRVAAGKVIEHWTNRDDMGTAVQLGRLPPSPDSLAQMAAGLDEGRRGHRP